LREASESAANPSKKPKTSPYGRSAASASTARYDKEAVLLGLDSLTNLCEKTKKRKVM